MDVERRSPVPLGWLAACALYVLVRALILHNAFDDVSIPVFELPGVGMIPKVALDGWKGPSPRFYYDNCGGLISTGVLAIPFYALLGSTYLALKLVPATLGLVALTLLWRYLDRNWSRAAANAAALLYAVGPPTLTRFSLIAQGNHFENIAFQLAVLTAFAAAQSRPQRVGRLIAYGIACGFAIFTYFGSLAIVALTGLLHLALRGPRRSLRDLPFVLGGFGVGILPLIWIGTVDGEPQRNISGMLAGEDGRDVGALDKLQHFALEVLPRAGCFESLGPLPRGLGEGLFLVAFLGSWLALLPGVARALLRSLRRWGRRRGDAALHEGFAELRHAPYVLYFPTIVAVIALGNLRFSSYVGPVEVGSYRYLVPHFMYAAMVIGSATTWLLRSPSRVRRAAGATLATSALASLAFALPMVPLGPARDVDPGVARVPAGLGAHYRGYWMPYYSGVALHRERFDRRARRYTWDFEEVLASIADFPPDQRQEIVLGIGYHLARALDLSPGVRAEDLLLELLAPFPAHDGVSLARGLGSYYAMMLATPGARRERAAQHLASSLRADHPLRPHVLEGLSISVAFPLSSTLENRFQRGRSVARLLPATLNADWMAGRGLEVGRLAGRGQPGDDAFLTAELRAPGYARSVSFWRGVGAGIAMQAAARDAAAILARWVPPQHRVQALHGLGSELQRYAPHTLEPVRWSSEHLDDETERSSFLRGFGTGH